jgi:hypothetical protein
MHVSNFANLFVLVSCREKLKKNVRLFMPRIHDLSEKHVSVCRAPLRYKYANFQNLKNENGTTTNRFQTRNVLLLLQTWIVRPTSQLLLHEAKIYTFPENHTQHPFD